MTPETFPGRICVSNSISDVAASFRISRRQHLNCGISSESNMSENIIYPSIDESAADLFPKVTDFINRFQSYFIFMHLNVNSYRHKFGYISGMLNKQCVDYLAISETKLDDSFPKSQFMVEGYSLYRQDLTNSSGGLIVYVRDDLPHRRIVHSAC